MFFGYLTRLPSRQNIAHFVIDSEKKGTAGEGEALLIEYSKTYVSPFRPLVNKSPFHKKNPLPNPNVPSVTEPSKFLFLSQLTE